MFADLCFTGFRNKTVNNIHLHLISFTTSKWFEWVTSVPFTYKKMKIVCVRYILIDTMDKLTLGIVIHNTTNYSKQCYIKTCIYLVQYSLLPLFYKVYGVHACKVTSVISDSMWPYGLQPARLLCPRDSSGNNTGVGCHALLQGIFLTQGSSPCLLCLCIGRKYLYH